jgi:indole-3-glycerol phosphate synthase
MHKIPYLIAEVKTGSPFGYHSDKSWDELFEVASSVGDMISVHTDPRWSGSFDLISRAKGLTDKPILAKGIHENDDHVRLALKLGASAVLVIGRLPADVLRSSCLLEPTSLEQLKEFLSITDDTQRFVWNSRNLINGSKRDPAEFQIARKLCSGWLCQASMITTPDDIESAADAILVGEHIANFSSLL